MNQDLYFFDTEFVEDGSTIMPISLGMVTLKGRELYIEFDFDEKKANEHNFVRENVLPLLTGQDRISKDEGANRILEFVGLPIPGESRRRPQFWAWFASYDWLLLCQLFGRMIDLPPHFPMFCMDLRQYYEDLGCPVMANPSTPRAQHNALADARWNRELYWSLRKGDPVPEREWNLALAESKRD